MKNWFLDGETRKSLLDQIVMFTRLLETLAGGGRSIMLSPPHSSWAFDFYLSRELPESFEDVCFKIGRYTIKVFRRLASTRPLLTVFSCGYEILYEERSVKKRVFDDSFIGNIGIPGCKSLLQDLNLLFVLRRLLSSHCLEADSEATLFSDIFSEEVRRGARRPLSFREYFDEGEIYYLERYGLVEDVGERAIQAKVLAMGSGVLGNTLAFLDLQAKEAIRCAVRRREILSREKPLAEKLEECLLWGDERIVPGIPQRDYQGDPLNLLLYTEDEFGQSERRWLEALGKAGLAGSNLIVTSFLEQAIPIAETGQCQALFIHRTKNPDEGQLFTEMPLDVRGMLLNATEAARSFMGEEEYLPMPCFEFSPKDSTSLPELNGFVEEYFPVKREIAPLEKICA